MADEIALDKLKDKMNRLRDTNSGIVNEIESMGHAVDLTIARLEHFMAYLVEVGVLTERQMIESCYTWELNLKNQLVPLVRDMRERRDKMLKEQQTRRRKIEDVPLKIVGKDESGTPTALVFPPGTKFEKVEDGQERDSEASADS